MQTLLYGLLLIGCFIVLIKGADFLVSGASYIARALKIPAVIIGLTIVAFGTSAPEAGVSIVSSINHDNALSISNVVGSNVFNLLIVAGVCAAIKAFDIDKDIRKRDYPICIFVTVLLAVFSFDRCISRVEGIILVVLIVSYCSMLVHSAKKNPLADLSAEENDKLPARHKINTKNTIINCLIILLSIGAIYLSSEGIVKSSSYFATLFGVSDTIIGLTIVACGTSLPELVTSIVASRKGESGIALGNVVGSNIFNILFVLGMAGTISPMKIGIDNVVDSFVCLGVTLVCYIFVLRGNKLKRSEGIIMISIYVIYMVFVFMREFNVIVL